MTNRNAHAAEQLLLVTSIGTDRPGIVEELTAWFLEHGGNVQESRMTRLGNQFAALVLVNGSRGFAEALERTRESFSERTGQHVLLQRLEATAAPTQPPCLRYRLEAAALDHPGIVHRLAAVLRRFAISIADVVTHVDAAPFTGAPVFRVLMEVDIPGGTDIARLRAELSSAAAADGIDVTLAPA